MSEQKGAEYKFTFRVSSNTGGLREYKNLPRNVVNADELRKYAREFFDNLEAQIKRSEAAAPEFYATRARLIGK